MSEIYRKKRNDVREATSQLASKLLKVLFRRWKNCFQPTIDKISKKRKKYDESLIGVMKRLFNR